jgi:hypothetical protein
MPRISEDYIRREFLKQFAAMTKDRRLGTIEALTVVHEIALANDRIPEIELPIADNGEVRRISKVTGEEEVVRPVAGFLVDTGS